MYALYGLKLGCSVWRTGVGAYCAASRTACYFHIDLYSELMIAVSALSYLVKFFNGDS